MQYSQIDTSNPTRLLYFASNKKKKKTIEIGTYQAAV